MERLLKISIYACLLWLNMGVVTMAQNSEFLYNAVVSTKNNAWSLRVNDLYVMDNTRTSHANVSPSIVSQMKSGKNIVSLRFAPIVAKDPNTGEYISELHDGIEISIKIFRNGWLARTREEIDLVRIRYDDRSQSWINIEESSSGSSRVLKTEFLTTSGKYKITSEKTDQVVLSSGLRADAYRLDVEFDTADYFPPFHWEKEAVRLEDTPEMRRDLRKAYKDFYKLIQAKDSKVIIEKLSPVWERSAYLYMEDGGLNEFLEDTNIKETYAPISEDGSVLQDLGLSDDPLGDVVHFGAQQRLVWIRPHPFYWEYAPEGSEVFWEFPIVFYKDAAGKWHVADVATSPT